MTIFVTGTKTFFKQAASPTGWTKLTSVNEATLRVVSGSVATGGSVNFSSVFGTGGITAWPGSLTPSPGVSGSFTLTNNEIPAHTHSYVTANRNPDANRGPASPTAPARSYNYRYWPGPTSTSYTATAASGGGQSHNHPVDVGFTFTGDATQLNIKYVDIILAEKN